MYTKHAQYANTPNTKTIRIDSFLDTLQDRSVNDCQVSDYPLLFPSLSFQRHEKIPGETSVDKKKENEIIVILRR